MDQALAIAEAVAIAGLIASILQERLLSKLEGRSAQAAAILASLAIGIVATVRTGGFNGAATASDPFAFGIQVLAAAGLALAASQAAFRVLVKPIAA